jgi:hypothetical protein
MSHQDNMSKLNEENSLKTLEEGLIKSPGNDLDKVKETESPDDINKPASQGCPMHADPNFKPKKCFFVELNNGVSFLNLSTYYLVQFSYVCAFTFIDATQDYLLEEKYGMPREKTGTTNGDILLADTLYLVRLNFLFYYFNSELEKKINLIKHLSKFSTIFKSYQNRKILIFR